jgi:predicted nuclease of restriction endonuclease-like (RecB) superfamily
MTGRPSKGSSVSKPGRALLQRPVGELPAGYQALLEDLKSRIRSAQVKAALSVNRELIELYWGIGRSIVERQRVEGWGKAIVERLAGDLQREFPGVSGFSRNNIWYMRAFYLAWTEDIRDLQQPVGEMGGANLPQAVREIPWGHNIQLFTKLKDPVQRLWYAQQTIANGWSRSMLEHWIESGLHKRQGKAITNFKNTLPPPQSDLAAQAIKDPYSFDFLTLRTDAAEREIEKGLIDHIRKFLIELGAGFAFVGQQYHLEVDGEDFYLDLLFYHLHLRCYVVIEMKAVAFKPEFAGKMNFYLSAVDDLLRHSDDKPSIGLILCKTRSKVIAEYALRDLVKPVGVTRYVTKLVASLPPDLRRALPSPKQLQMELRKSKGVDDEE